MPLKEWNCFNKGEKNNSIHFWAQCKATSCDAKIAGTKDGMAAHLKRCNYLEEERCKEYQNTKRKITQQTFHIVNSYSAPITKTEYDEFQKQNLYACLDANLAFHYTESLHFQKLFKMMKSIVKMPSRKVVSR